MHLRARWNRRGGIFAIGSAVLLIAATVPAWSQPGENLPGLGAALAAQADVDPTISIVATDADAAEAGTNTGTFTITRTGDTTQPVQVTFDVTGTATTGTDYLALSSPATIAAGSATTTLTVTPLDDSKDEADETVTVTLTSAPGYVVGTSAAATVTIADDDLPVVSVTASDPSASEGGGDLGEFTVARDGLTTGSLTVFYTVSGSAKAGIDYSGLGGSVVIASGQSSATIAVAPIPDDIAEAPETVELTLNTGAGYVLGSSTKAIVTIADDDLPTVTVSASDPKAEEHDLEPGAFTITRTGDTRGSLAVDYSVGGTATAGSDYSSLGVSVVIPAGQSTVVIKVTPLADTEEEGDETVILTLTDTARYDVGTAGSATVTIEDDDRVSAPDVEGMPADKDACKKGGWMDFGVFKNQGDCVSWVATGGKNPPALAGSDSTSSDSATAAPAPRPHPGKGKGKGKKK